MRISTQNFYSGSGSRLSDLQARVDHTMQQIASGSKLQTPSQDPAAAVRTLEVTQSMAMREQFGKNRESVRSNLGLADSTLSGMLDNLAGINEQIILANNSTRTSQDLASIATVLKGQQDQMLALANTTDSSGNYIFSGQQSSIKPFQSDAEGVSYQGDEQPQMVQVETGREMAIREDGRSLFPKDGSDKDLFALLGQTIAQLQDGSLTPAQRADSLKALGQSIESTRIALSSRQTAVGVHMGELDRLDDLSGSRLLQSTEELSSLQDLDYNKTLSDLSRQQLSLQAAQKSFQMVSSLSLFNYLS